MAAAAPTASQVRLSFSASDVPSKDLLSPSDTFLILSERTPDGNWVKVGQTEVQVNVKSPKFTKSFEVNYFFEKNQVFKVDAFDWDDATQHDYIGSFEFTLGNVVAGYNSQTDGPLMKGALQAGKARVQVRADTLQTSKLKAFCQVSVKDLKKSSFFANIDKDDTFLEMVKIRPDGSELVIYKSETVWDTQKPKYKPFKICLGQLCDSNLDQPFIFRINRVKSSGAIEFMGDNRTVTPRQLAVNPGEHSKKIDIFNSKGKDIADVFFDLFHIKEEASFLDYITAGLDLNLTVAIDFTQSNGDPKQQSSLHYLDPTMQKKNEYIEALRSIGNILASYAQKQMMPALGYGGFLSVDGQPPTTSHCFPLSGSSQHAWCNGIEGVVQTYVNALQYVQLSGPTYFESIVNSAAASAARPYTEDYQHFQILLIITDGIINDMDKTVDAIVAASDRPLCIIIVGVGVSRNTDFSSMRLLDGDDGKLRSKRFGPAKNDIVQFVEFSPQYVNNPALLAQETLREIPTCVTNFMHMHGIKPATKRQPPPQEQIAAPQ